MQKSTLYIASTSFAFFSALSVYWLLTDKSYDGMTMLMFGPIKFELKYAINSGINFGIAGENSSLRQILLALAALAVVGLMSVWSFSKPNKYHVFFTAIFCGGGLSNAYERVVYGGVFDYLNVSLIFYQNPFSFNLADIYIFLGLVFLVFLPK